MMLRITCAVHGPVALECASCAVEDATGQSGSDVLSAARLDAARKVRDAMLTDLAAMSDLAEAEQFRSKWLRDDAALARIVAGEEA